LDCLRKGDVTMKWEGTWEELKAEKPGFALMVEMGRRQCAHDMDVELEDVRVGGCAEYTDEAKQRSGAEGVALYVYPEVFVAVVAYTREWSAEIHDDIEMQIEGAALYEISPEFAELKEERVLDMIERVVTDE
jgi:hypothetical protein